ncbi:MAG: D-alanyl-D-alanine carboxypeptidase/D-alanyl-D-alanine-endopeptidase [Bacteroidales bacterium]|nr:D-alanyl-D-alanine carboxypeptidase/D-alanyl-D-alanine-endopeptidase [Bacteroidales bacterium]
MRHNTLFLTLFLLTSLLCATTLHAHNDGMTMALQIVDVENGTLIVDENSNVCLTPASITKIITTATALELLGPDFKFETHLAYDGKVENGVLNGNLYIIGGGDPTLGSVYVQNNGFLEKWVDAVRKAGIRQINGAVVADATIFDNMPIPSGWLWEDMGNYYAAGVFGLSVYDNMISITMTTQQSGSKPNVVDVTPAIPDLQLDNQLTAEGNSDEAYIYGVPYNNQRLMMGTVPTNKSKFVLKGDIPNPPLLLATQLSETLTNNGITVGKPATDKVNNKEERTTLCTIQSPKLSDIVKETNFRSLNHYAEHLLKFLALQQGKEATTNNGTEVVKIFWKQRGIETNTLFMLDGSGLSPHTAIPAKTFNDILQYMYKKSKNRDVFMQSLPVAGESGTVARLFKKTALEKKARLKSGSMSRVQCYSGYVNYQNKTYAITVMVNNFDTKRSEVRSMIEKRIIDAIIKK